MSTENTIADTGADWGIDFLVRILVLKGFGHETEARGLRSRCPAVEPSSASVSCMYPSQYLQTCKSYIESTFDLFGTYF